LTAFRYQLFLIFDPLVWDQEVAGSNPVAPTTAPLRPPISRLNQISGSSREGSPLPSTGIPRFVWFGSLAAALLYLGAFCWVFGGRAAWPGSESYAQLAGHLAAGQGYSMDGVSPTALRPPLYPLILAATMRVAGSHWFEATVVLQALAAAGCLVAVFALARSIWPGTRAAWLGAGLLAIHGPFMFEMLSLRETVWFTLALLGVAWLLWHRTDRAVRALLLGLLLAALYLLRPTGLVVAGVTLTFVGWEAVRRRPGAARNLVLTLGAALLAVAPWQLFTSRHFGAPGFFPASTNGYNLAKGADAQLTLVSPWIDADSLDGRVRQLTSNIPTADERAADQALRRIAADLIRANPRSIVYRSVLSAGEFVSPLPIPLGAGSLRQTAGGPVIENFRPHWEELAFAPVVLVLLGASVVGLRRLLRLGSGPESLGLWMIAVFLAVLAVHALTFTKTRYRLPLDALLAVPAGGCLAGRGRRPPPPEAG